MADAVSAHHDSAIAGLALQLLREVFGYSDFRGPQADDHRARVRRAATRWC